MAIETSSGTRLFEAHVERFNAGVRSGDFGPMVAGFSDDARLVFEGIPVGPFEGRDAIDAAYREQPPDDEIDDPVGRRAGRRDRRRPLRLEGDRGDGHDDADPCWRRRSRA